MSISFYTLLHIIGLILLGQAVGAASFHRMQTGEASHPRMKLLSIMHGVGLLFMLVSGFGMLAQLGITGGLPNWIYAKLAIWLVFGASIALVNRGKGSPMLWWALVVVLGGVAGWLGIFKPF